MALRLQSATFESALRETVESGEYDIVQIEGIEMGPYLLWLRQWIQSRPSTTRRPRLVFEDHNAEYMLQRRAYEADRRRIRRWIGAAYSWIQWRRLRNYEAHVCRSADAVVAVSDADAAALESLVPDLRPAVVPNGVDLRLYDPIGVTPLPLGSNVLLFTGKMDFRPNVDGVLWFCDEVWPLVRQRIANAQFFVVGKDPHPRLRRLHDLPGVTVTGWVDQILPYFAGASLYVVPLCVGGGTRLKILEAMAMGLPMVSTTLGAEGLDVESGEQLMLADDPDQFAAAATALLEDESASKRLGAKAQRFVRQRYGWPAIVPRLEEVYASLQ
jgi:glycosyltransferase involved in cell wall biosynthesis